MDEEIPQEETPQETPQEKAPVKEAKPKRVEAKHAPKRHVAKPTRHAAVKAPPAPKALRPAGNGALIAVYVILGILVIATSFYTGYLVGKSSDTTGDDGTQTGTVGTTKLQIVTYSDYQCPFCGRVEPTLAQLKQAYGDKIEFVFKNFPLESIHPDALGAAIAAECARDQSDEKFWAYHDKLFANQGALTIANLKQYAVDLKLDVSAFNDCLDNKKTESRVRADMQEAQAKGVQGTPSFWIKDELFVGAQPLDNFKAKIDEKLSGKAAPAPTPTPAAPEQPAEKVDVTAGRYVQGDKAATVEIVMFSDFQCPFCKRFYDSSEGQIIADYVKTGKARISFRNFPLSFHQNAQKAAEAAECAGKQNKFWEMHDVLFTKGTGDGTGLAVADLKQYAADLKLDTAAFNKCLDGGETASIVTKDLQDGQAAGVQGTPTTFVNGKAVVGAVPYATIKAAIDAELS